MNAAKNREEWKRIGCPLQNGKMVHSAVGFTVMFSQPVSSKVGKLMQNVSFVNH